MKPQNFLRATLFVFLLFTAITTTQAQFSLKKLKKEVKNEVAAESTNQKEKLKQKAIAKASGSAEQLCSKLKGDKEITSSSPAYESYTSLLAELKTAEQKVISGDNEGAKDHMGKAGEFMTMVLLKEPKADFSSVCSQIMVINTKLK